MEQTIYSHMNGDSSIRFIGIKGQEPPWAVNIQDYVESTAESVIGERYCSSMSEDNLHSWAENAQKELDILRAKINGNVLLPIAPNEILLEALNEGVCADQCNNVWFEPEEAYAALITVLRTSE